MRWMMRCGDLLLVLSGGWLAYLLRTGHDNPVGDGHYPLALGLACLLTPVIFTKMAIYRDWRRGTPAVMLGRLLLAWCVTLGGLALAGFLSKTGAEFSRLWFGYWAIITFVGMVGSRLAGERLAAWLQRRGIGIRHVVLVGREDMIDGVSTSLAKERRPAFRVIARYAVPCIDGSNGTNEARAARIRALPRWVDQQEADEVWLAWPMREENTIREAAQLLSASKARVRWIPGTFASRLITHGVSDLAGMKAVDLTAPPISGVRRWLKEGSDKVLASLILILTSPLLVLIAFGVKLSSPGPVLFRQLRHGWDGRAIEVWKFRSMRVHEEVDGVTTQAQRKDARVTRFGTLLRRLSLDELPQFFNVLQGSMSIVGPRPHAVAHNEHYEQLIPGYLQRHRVKPGITGWAQVNGLRGETSDIEKMRMRVEYDLYYIQHWSLWLDLSIIFQTAFIWAFDRNAY